MVEFQDDELESRLSWVPCCWVYKNVCWPRHPSLPLETGHWVFWLALEEVFSVTRHQRCWVHKTANTLDKMPKKQQAQGKVLIHEIYLSAPQRCRRVLWPLSGILPSQVTRSMPMPIQRPGAAHGYPFGSNFIRNFLEYLSSVWIEGDRRLIHVILIMFAGTDENLAHEIRGSACNWFLY